jgi:hypothetical protein
MLTRVGTITVHVSDQDKALAFYLASVPGAVCDA